jgi:aminomethyltransferase
VTSGNFSPMLERGIALAFVDSAAGVLDGDRLVVEVRGHEVPVQVVRPRFWPPTPPAPRGAGPFLRPPAS